MPSNTLETLLDHLDPQVALSIATQIHQAAVDKLNTLPADPAVAEAEADVATAESLVEKYTPTSVTGA